MTEMLPATVDELVTITTRMSFGPAMTALTPRQRAFVIAYNNAGGKNATEAGRAVGFAPSSAKQYVSVLLRDPKIQLAMREDILARFTEDLPDTKRLLDKIALNEQHPKQFDALKVKLHQAGLIERTAVDMNVNVTLTFEQKVAQLQTLAALVGDDPADVLKGIIDVTPTVISDIEVTDEEGPPLW